MFCEEDKIMNTRIDYTSNGLKTIVHIAGRLSSTAVAHLEKACNPIEKPAVIDLSNLLIADDDGINAIRAIADKGAQVRGASPFVQLLLDNASRREPYGEI
jgi:hypothetical protein